MERYSLKIPILLGGLFAFTVLNAVADPDFDGVRNLVMQTVKESEKGVILMVSERGQAAADAANLLSTQLENNPGYKPLLMVPMDSQLKASLKELALSKDALPALIFFNKSGKEIARVVDAIPSNEKLKTDNISAEVVNAEKLGTAINVRS